MTQVCICARSQLIRHAYLQPIWLYWVSGDWRVERVNKSLMVVVVSTAPAIRLVDEMGHEVSDRYYKLGSSVDITCQVALSFLNTIPSSPGTNFNDKFPSPPTTEAITARTIPTTTIFPFIDINLIRKTFEQQIPYSGKHNIKWRKDGKDLPKDIKINLRFVRHNQPSSVTFSFMSTASRACLPSTSFHSLSIIIWIIYRSNFCLPCLLFFLLLLPFHLRKQHNLHMAKQQNFDYTCWKNSQWHLLLLRRQHDILDR